MSIAIIAEYNPFHNGHIYQLQQCKLRWPNEEIIIFLSGEYVQRGEKAVASFESRKNMALEYGATKVVELPFQYATQAAHIFAEGALLLARKHQVDKIFFGSESNNPSLLMEIAQTIYEREQEYNLLLKSNLKLGLSFPKSSANALYSLMSKEIVMPNDILGLEYCKAIVKHNLPIKPFTLEREVGFHSLTPSDKIASATYIRKTLKEGGDVSEYTPMKFSYPLPLIEDEYPKFQEIVRKSTPEELKEIHLVAEGMENLFKKHVEATTYEDFVNATNSKRYTSSRIKRVILYILLGVKRQTLTSSLLQP